MNYGIALRRGLLLACTSLLLAVAGCGDEGCPTGFENCDGLCTNTSTSRAHCGACGNICAAGELCSAGVCELGCPDGQEACIGTCVDVGRDPLNCGGCGNPCGNGEVCMAGTCDTRCVAGFSNCGGSCRDIQNDNANCGGCGSACDVGERCVEGDCEATCGATQIVCDGVCADIDADSENCGRCGFACDAGEVCTAGECEVFCVPGLDACPDGSCRDLQNDVRNCGRCAARCRNGEACVEGACVQTCSGATPDLCGDSCVDLQSNPNFCGDCGTTCPLGAVCSLGVCELTCAPGLTDCGGACVDLNSDPTNCSACGTVCDAPMAGGLAACAGGTCAAVCPDGTADCNGDILEMAGDGCEVTPATDLANCGACGNVCAAPNATDACVDGACTIATCDAGFGDCDLVAGNGCETDTNVDDLNCGACGTVCTATEECTAGVCTPLTLAGDTCADALTITDGTQTLTWTAVGADVFLTPPAACSTTSLTGPDLVFEYTATADTTVDVQFGVPTSNRYSTIVTTTCTDETTQIACDSDFSPAEVTVSFPVTSGTTYYVWLRDTTSGSATLPNPIDVTVRSPSTGTILGYDRSAIGTCTPGTGGYVGVGPATTFDSGRSDFPAYIVADQTSPTMGGFLYWGDTSATYRTRKDGTLLTSEDIELAAGLTSSQQGNNALVIGSNVYLLEDTTSSLTTRLNRITSTGGPPYSVQAASGAFSPVDDGFDGIVAEGNTAYIVSEETSSATSSATEIYSLDLSGALPATPSLVTTVGGRGNYDCNAITLDSTYFYLACAGVDRIVRVNRTTFAVQLVTADINLISFSVNGLIAVDIPPAGMTMGDGLADALYVKGEDDGIWLVCNPSDPAISSRGAPAGLFYRYGTSTGDDGMAYDEDTSTLYLYDGSTDEIRVVP
mgnify:CR=1 FL=1